MATEDTVCMSQREVKRLQVTQEQRLRWAIDAVGSR